MPTYEYACSSCQNEWEFEQSIKDAALTECPRCHQQTARRQISRGTGFILKGGGWYADLYSSTGNKGGSDSSSGSSNGSSGSSSSSSSGSSSSDSGSSAKSETSASAA
jgi:putative FmdB family regulatory protein